MAKFQLHCKSYGSEKVMIEEYNKETSDPVQWCKDTIEKFNKTLRPGEKPRSFVKCVVLPEKLDRNGKLVDPPKIAHEYQKQNMVTIYEPGVGYYDVHKCKNCKVTGKVFTLDGTVIRDKQFKNKEFIFCDRRK